MIGYGPRMRCALVFSLVLAACGGKSNPPPPVGGSGTGAGPAPADDCIRTGCSGIICTEPGNEQITTCEYKPEYACYEQASCERQADGTCGWTQTEALASCLANPPGQ